ncbi:hypothetical protein [Bacillus massiliigorillae]|uniref:Y-family DNA polymerase n=1 Tax=Bacillus massiliigorillae TaxID=1243664 RepID=UPI0034DEF5B7
MDKIMLDVSKSTRLFGDEFSIAKQIQEDILNELGLYATVGICPNPLMVKLVLNIESK